MSALYLKDYTNKKLLYAASKGAFTMSSTYSLGSSSTSTTSRISGLASQLDTDSMIKDMMAASQAKINKVEQQKQLLEWKQEDYRTIISKLKSFQSKYFSSSSSSSVLSSGFYSSKAVSLLNSTDSNYIGITAAATSDASQISVSNIKAATNSKAETAKTVCKQITIDFDTESTPIDLSGKSFNLTVDGVTKSITFSKSYSTAEELSADIQALADSAFGTDRLTVSVSENSISINSDGVEASVSGVATIDALSVPGLTLTNDKTNRIDLTKTIADTSFATALSGDTFAFTINGKSFEFDSGATLSTVIKAINSSNAGVKVSYSSINDKFIMTSTSTGESSEITISDDSGNLMTAFMGTLEGSNFTAGTNASLYINGKKVTRSENTFTIDGITYSLKADTESTISASISTDIDSAVNNIKAFINDYNDLLKTLTSKMSEDRNRDYFPLTDAQKEEMTESQITKWEEKARSGLLKNDISIQNTITSLRKTMYTAVNNLEDNTENLGISMSSIGISTSGYESKGQLEIDEGKLRVALSNNLDKVLSLFTQTSDKIYLPTNTAEVKSERYGEEGIMNRISDILNDSVRTTLGGGTLLQIAGYTGSSTLTNNLFTQSIKKYDRKLDDLLDAFNREETRYYNQFTAMEQYISQMNQTSNWLSGISNS